MSDGTGLAEAMLGLAGFTVLKVTEGEDEVVIAVETTASVTGCWSCGVLAECQDRVRVDIRDLTCFGRPARLVWSKRRWRCRELECPAKTWTERSVHVPPRALLTCRAGIEACRQVGELARPVSGVADELGVCWWTVMHAVERHGRPLVEDPARVGPVVALGVDETSFLKANREHPVIYATGLVDLDAKLVIDMVKGNAAKDLRRWCASADQDWLKGIKVVATDLAESYRAGLSPHLDHAVRVADPFHVVRVANRCLDTVRRRVQNDLLGHRGRKEDPLYRIRKLLLSGAERLDERGSSRMLLGLRLGDPDDAVLGAWLAKESVRDVYHRRLSRRRGARDPITRQHLEALAARDPQPPSNGRFERTDGGAQLVREEGQACRSWLCLFRPLSPSSAASCRWSHLAVTAKSTEDPNELSPLKRVGPH